MNRMRKGSESFNEPNLHFESRQDESPSSRPALFASFCLFCRSRSELTASTYIFHFHQKFNKKVIAISASTATACSRQCTLNFFVEMSTVEAPLEGKHRITIFIKSLSSLTRFYRYFPLLVGMLQKKKTARMQKKIKALVRH